MSDKQEKIKVMTVSRRYTRFKIKVPFIRMQGEWLKEAGFHVSDNIIVEVVAKGQIVLTTVARQKEIMQNVGNTSGASNGGMCANRAGGDVRNDVDGVSEGSADVQVLKSVAVNQSTDDQKGTKTSEVKVNGNDDLQVDGTKAANQTVPDGCEGGGAGSVVSG